MSGDEQLMSMPRDENPEQDNMLQSQTGPLANSIIEDMLVSLIDRSASQDQPLPTPESASQQLAAEPPVSAASLPPTPTPEAPIIPPTIQDTQDSGSSIEQVFQNLFSNILTNLEQKLEEDGTDKGIMFNIIKVLFEKLTAEEDVEEGTQSTPPNAPSQPAADPSPRVNQPRQQPRQAPRPNPTQSPPTTIALANLTPEQTRDFDYLNENGFNQQQLLRLHANLGVDIPLETFISYSVAIVEAALRSNLQPSIMYPFTLATIKNESDFRPNITNRSGFGGLGQHPQRYWETQGGDGRGQRLMEEYPQEYTSLPSRFDPIASIRATVFLYKSILGSLGANPSSLSSYNQQTLARDWYAAYNLGSGLVDEFKYLSALPREQVAQIGRMSIEQRIREHPELGERDIPQYLYDRIANPYRGTSDTTAFERVQNTYNEYAQILRTTA